MLRTGVVIAVAAALLTPDVAPAQERERERERERIQIDRVPLGAGSNEMIRVLSNRRARLGVNVDLQAEAADTIGARIEGVTPGGPADKAGLRAGDIITKLNGQTLYSRETASRNVRQSMPGLRLIELAARLEPNDTVAVEYRRGNDRRTARLVTAEDPNHFVFRSDSGMFTYERMLPAVRGGMAATEPLALWMLNSPLGRLELAPINADLGQYFGVTEGVLVIDAPKDSDLKLRGGDVVLSVDGRAPTGPQHLLRILRSYEPGESVRLEIQRNRRRETVTATIEGARERMLQRTPARPPS
jgi:S1-C subfamily serine protease